MNLRQWTSNSDEFLHLLPEDQKSTEYVVKLFGLLWNRIDDYIQITGADIARQGFTITKRHVLSCVAKIYDPLGFISPITFHGKVFLQNLWKHDLKWDECLPQSLCQEWKKIIGILEHIAAIKIPRLIGTHEQDPVHEVLVFCDASIKSYAAVVYIRVISQHGIQSNLMFSKMRLAPVTSSRGQKGKKCKDITLP